VKDPSLALGLTLSMFLAVVKTQDARAESSPSTSRARRPSGIAGRELAGPVDRKRVLDPLARSTAIECSADARARRIAAPAQREAARAARVLPRQAVRRLWHLHTTRGDIRVPSVGLARAIGSTTSLHRGQPTAPTGLRALGASVDRLAADPGDAGDDGHGPPCNQFALAGPRASALPAPQEFPGDPRLHRSRASARSKRESWQWSRSVSVFIGASASGPTNARACGSDAVAAPRGVRVRGRSPDTSRVRR
jgi:hypothetical protein